jgi:hypothetical protein
MKTFKILSVFALLLTGAFLFSCQKVIKIDLKDKDRKIVIEGVFVAGETTSTVTVTKTLNFDEEAPYPTIDNAVVTVTDNLGNTQVLTFTGNGTYQTTAYPVMEGRTYTLTVNIDGSVYTASSTVPAMVQIDTVKVLQIGFGPDTLNALVPVRTDPAGVRNFYQFNLYQNSERIEGIYLQNDDFTDGIISEEPVFGGEFEAGDTALVEMFCIDEPVFNYFFALLQNQQATPANPPSNFSGGCMGYFSARTKHSAWVIIP